MPEGERLRKNRGRVIRGQRLGGNGRLTIQDDDTMAHMGLTSAVPFPIHLSGEHFLGLRLGFHEPTSGASGVRHGIECVTRRGNEFVSHYRQGQPRSAHHLSHKRSTSTHPCLPEATAVDCTPLPEWNGD